MSKVIMSETDGWELQYMDWDVNETIMTLESIFPDANEIRYIVPYDEDNIIVEVDGIRYIVRYDGEYRLDE